MKKLFAIILCAAAVFLTACGTNSGGETTMSIEANTAESSVKSNDIPFYTKEIKDDPSDPYAADIKEYCEGVASRFKGKDASDFEWYMRQIPYMYYCFYDMNGDGVDEMLLGDWKKVGKNTEDHDPARALKLSAVATLKNGEVVRMNFDDLHWSEFIYDRVLYSNGLVVTTYGNEEKPSYFFAAFDGTSLIMKDNLYYFKSDDTYYRNNDNIVTEEEYHRLIAENIGDATPVEIEWKRVDQYGQ